MFGWKFGYQFVSLFSNIEIIRFMLMFIAGTPRGWFSDGAECFYYLTEDEIQIAIVRGKKFSLVSGFNIFPGVTGLSPLTSFLCAPLSRKS